MSRYALHVRQAEDFAPERTYPVTKRVIHPSDVTLIDALSVWGVVIFMQVVGRIKLSQAKGRSDLKNLDAIKIAYIGGTIISLFVGIVLTVLAVKNSVS